MERFTQESVKRPMKEEEEEGRRQKYLVVINPVSRGGKAIKEGLWLLKQMGRLGVNHETFITENPGHAEDIVKRWVEQVDVVVAVGGDGTVNEILNGMMSSEGCEKTLAVFPAGTADDYCHNVGIPRDRNRALDILLTDNSRMIDLIKWNDRYAIVQVGVGVDAEVAFNALRYKTVRIAAYFAVGLRIVFKERLRNSSKMMRIEGQNGVHDGTFLIAAFGNAPLYGRYVYWFPDAKMDDGILNMSALKPMAPIPAWYLLMRSFNRDYRSDRVLHDEGERFTVELREESFMQVDGEVYKYAAGEKLKLSMVRDALKVRVPRELPDPPPFVKC